MKPKEILQAAFEEFISPELDGHGFGYVRSGFAYKRKSGDFTQEISITLSHYNTQNSVVFWSAFNVTSPAYNRWLKKQRREKFDGYLGGCMDWNVPGWRQADNHQLRFDYSDPDSRREVLSDWLAKCTSAGFSYLQKLSTWEGAAEDLLANEWHWNRAADFCLIACRSDLAIAALERGIQFLATMEFSYSEKSHPTLVTKKKRQAVERDAEVAAFKSRIEEIQRSEQQRPADAAKPRGWP
ncbi:MAG: hypothetical protein HQ518_21835 [Rhodopirellula sp.]|nr:hypothetical protein [Rhodopirellula sp.]